MNTGYRIEMKNVFKNLGGINALKNVDCMMNPGGIYALVGQMFVANVVGEVIGGLKCL